MNLTKPYTHCGASRPKIQASNRILETWPNVFRAIVDDFGDEGFTCPEGRPPSHASGENVAYCIALTFKDNPSSTQDRRFSAR